MKTKKTGVDAGAKVAATTEEGGTTELHQDDSAWHSEVGDRFIKGANPGLYSAMESLSQTLEKVKARQNKKKV